MRRAEPPRPHARNIEHECERPLRQAVLILCPVCRVWGPTALLERHLAEDHGQWAEDDGLVAAGSD